MEAVDWMAGWNISQLKIMFCKRFDQDSPIWNLERHSHSYLELLFFLRGEAKIDTDNRVLSTATYDIVVYLPGHEHRETVDLSKHQEIICVWVDAGQPPPIREGSFHMRDKSRTLEWLFQQLEKEYRGNSIFSQKLVQCYLEAILQTTIRKLVQNGSESAADSIDQVRAYINEHFTQPLTVEFLAKLCHVSPSYLHRIFRRQLGMSPIQYIRDLRIKEAEYLLNSSDMTVAVIAERCGFEDPRYFSRIFRKRTGLSPSLYRANCMKA